MSTQNENENESVELQRERWRRARRTLRLIDPEAEDFLTRSLVPLKDGSTVRLLILPGDPEASTIAFDRELWSWWLEERPDPIWRGECGSVQRREAYRV